MATSGINTNENSISAKDFHLSSSSDTSHHLTSSQKCPLCRKLKNTFYCKDCICSGQFCRSKSVSTERYYDIHNLFSEVLRMRKNLELNCAVLLDTKKKGDTLYFKIQHAKERNRLLKKVIEEKMRAITINNIKLTEIKAKNERRKRHIPQYEQKVYEMENYAANDRDQMERSQRIYNEQQARIRKLVNLRIQQLFKFIFPIVEINPIHSEFESGDETISAIAEASQTTYIRDRWEYADYSAEKQYCIVAPTLPSSGNYSSYNIWVTQSQDVGLGSNSTAVDHNPAFTISAALTYTAQLLHILSFYLNVRLPHKMFYSDFCSNDMDEQQFTRRVARLNANILYLCFSQNVNPCSLNACGTIHNILQLTQDDKAELGREGPIELRDEDVDALELPLENDLKKGDLSDSEEGDSFPLEWEAVPHIHCPEISAGPVVQSPQMVATQQASSVTGGLVNSAAASIASLWRGFTGR